MGIIGVGKMGKLHLLNALHMKHVKVVAVADRNKRRLAAAKENGVRTYDDFYTLFDTEDIDAAVISIPNFLKEKSIAYASEKGVDVFVDKPLASTFPQALRIAQKVKEEGTRLGVGSNCRFFDCVQSLKKRLEEGRIGDVVLSTAQLIINGPFSHPLEPRPVSEWYFDKKASGGGAILDLGYHLIDLFNWMFGDSEILHSSLGYRYGLPVEDSGTIVLKSRRTSTTGTINVGWFCKQIFPQYNFNVSLHGTAGCASTDQFTPSNFYLHALKEGALNLLRRVTLRPIHYLTYTYYYPSHFRVLEAFFKAVANGDTTPIDLASQLAVMKTIDDIYQGNGVECHD